jgi:hypothetical protein
MHKPSRQKRTCLQSRRILASTSDGLLLGTDTPWENEVSTPFEFEFSPQNIPVYLCQIAEGIDESKRHSSRLSWHIAESRCGIRKCTSIRRPQSSSHDYQQSETCLEVVHGTDHHRGDQAASEPSRDDQTSLFRILVAEVPRYDDCHKGDRCSIVSIGFLRKERFSSDHK